jgi:hypothetical protein
MFGGVGAPRVTTARPGARVTGCPDPSHDDGAVMHGSPVSVAGASHTDLFWVRGGGCVPGRAARHLHGMVLNCCRAGHEGGEGEGDRSLGVIQSRREGIRNSKTGKIVKMHTLRH